VYTFLDPLICVCVKYLSYLSYKYYHSHVIQEYVCCHYIVGIQTFFIVQFILVHVGEHIVTFTFLMDEFMGAARMFPFFRGRSELICFQTYV
jgi:hypothetical protein